MTNAEWMALLKESPKDVGTRRAYADWLEDQGEVLLAARQREKLGLGRLELRLRNKLTDKQQMPYRQVGHMRNRLDDYLGYCNDASGTHVPRNSTIMGNSPDLHWPSWLMDGARVDDSDVVWVWIAAPVVVSVVAEDVRAFVKGEKR